MGGTGNGRVESCRDKNTPAFRREGNREETFETASINAVWGSGWVKSLTKVNCYTHRHWQKAKDADRLQPKGMQSVASHSDWGTRISVHRHTSGVHQFRVGRRASVAGVTPRDRR